MRSTEQIKKIKNRITDPYFIDNFLTEKDVNSLVSIFENHRGDKIFKNTGPVTLDIGYYRDNEIFKIILKKLQQEIGNFSITSAFFFQTDFPHIIHNDDTFEFPDVYKGITIPLKLYSAGKGFPKLCFFDQFYFNGPAKFFNGSENVPTYYNKQVYEYSEVDGIVDSKIEDNWNYFSHLKPEWLHGLSLNSAIDWKPTRAIIFDSVRLHCASDFRNLGYTKKLGLSIFTKIDT